MCKCLECNDEFVNERSLHAHLKAHKISVSEYYTKHFAKTSVATGELIIFKNLEDYKNAYFNSRAEMRKWFSKIAKKGDALQKKNASSIGAKMILKRMEEKGSTFIPSEFELSTVNAPTLSVLNEINPNFISELNRELTFSNNIYFNKNKVDSYFVDTREQNPWDFESKIVTKLEFGDYAAAGKSFSNVFVDRKSDADFISTFTNGFERFEKELNRAIKQDAFLIVVCEANLGALYKKCQVFGSKRVLDLALSNTRNLLTRYPRKIQFVLCDSRADARDITIDILGSGEKAREIDWQYYNNLCGTRV